MWNIILVLKISFASMAHLRDQPNSDIYHLLNIKIKISKCIGIAVCMYCTNLSVYLCHHDPDYWVVYCVYDSV